MTTNYCETFQFLNLIYNVPLLLILEQMIFSFRQNIVSEMLIRVPTRTGKPGKMGRHFPVREKSGNFEQTGKVREKSGKITQNTGKLREFEINII